MYWRGFVLASFTRVLPLPACVAASSLTFAALSSSHPFRVRTTTGSRPTDPCCAMPLIVPRPMCATNRPQAVHDLHANVHAMAASPEKPDGPGREFPNKVPSCA